MRDLIYLITSVTCPGNGFFTNFANRRRCQIRTAHSARISIEHIKKYKYYLLGLWIWILLIRLNYIDYTTKWNFGSFEIFVQKILTI